MEKAKRIAMGIVLVGLLGLIALSSCEITVPADHNGERVDNTNFSAAEPFSFEVAVKTQSRFVLAAINGSIDVVGVPGTSSVKIWGERIVKSESEADAQAHLEKLEVQVKDGDEEVFVKTVQPGETQGRTYVVNYHIQMPDTWDFYLETINGEMAVDSLNATVSIGATNGNVKLTKVTGTVSVNLTNGNIWLRDLVGSVKVDLTNGTIDGRVSLTAQAICDMEITNGGISLGIPKTTSATFSAKVVNGSVSVSELALSNMSTSRTSVSGILGDGKGTVNLRTTNGNIKVWGF
ncbi:MAG: DUF4097 domain-containing protein [candidate division KSB1 bacterium]|nr:DUF4097 domain-containing protein [candidate division KSB1 bacterium]